MGRPQVQPRPVGAPPRDEDWQFQCKCGGGSVCDGHFWSALRRVVQLDRLGRGLPPFRGPAEVLSECEEERL